MMKKIKTNKYNNMKNKLLFALMFLVYFAANAQVKVGDNPTTIDNSALLEMESTTKGLLPPRMTTAQINAIPSPATGLIVYNTTLGCLQVNDGVPVTPEWNCISGSAIAVNPLLADIGIDAANGNNALTSGFTAADFNSIPGVSGAIAANEAAYLAAIAANEGPFSSPATAAEVQAMIDAVNAAQSLLANIGTDAANGDNATTTGTTAADLNAIVGVSGAIAANEAAYLAAIAANEGPFSSPATAAEVQAMIDAVNAAQSLLANIGTDAANGDNATTTGTTAADLNAIVGVSGATAANEAAYLAAIAANEGPFSSPATAAEVQAMIDAVNAAQTLLANIGTDADNGNNALTSGVTAADLNAIVGVSGALAANEAAYLAAIAANEGPFSSPATAAEVQAMITAVNAAQTLLANIGTDADNGNNALTSGVTAADLNAIVGVSGAIAANEAAYLAAIAADAGPFSSPATAAEVQAMIDAVNAAQPLLANIGTDADNGNNALTSGVTAADFNSIPGVSGAIAANEAAYLAAIAANEGPFSSPATAAEVQAMVTAVNAAQTLLANIGTDAANGNNALTSGVTAADLNAIVGVSGAIAANEAAYLAAIAADAGPFSSPATAAEVQAMIDAVNAAQPLLANIGTDADNGNNALTSGVTAADFNSIPGVSGAIAANEAAYLAAIAANEGPFSSPATAAEVQAMVTAVNAAQTLLANIGTDAANGNNALTSGVTAADLNAIVGVSGAIAANEAAYLAAIAANEGPFSSPATAAEVQAMITAVNAIQALTLGTVTYQGVSVINTTGIGYNGETVPAASTITVLLSNSSASPQPYTLQATHAGTGLTYTASGTIAGSATNVPIILNHNQPAIAWTFFGVITMPVTGASNSINLLPRIDIKSIPASATTVVDVTYAGRVWMDRNLGARRVATSSTDVLSTGNLFQWGRLADGHNITVINGATTNTGRVLNATTATLSSSDTPGHGNFITASAAPNDWRSPQNTALWQGVSGTNNPCPTGYRIPTLAELDAVRLAWGTNNAAGAFASPLKLTMGGLTNFLSGNAANLGTEGRYWTSTAPSTSSNALLFSSTTASMTAYSRAMGLSVRCTKN
jgi:hypothetical protein